MNLQKVLLLLTMTVLIQGTASESFAQRGANRQATKTQAQPKVNKATSAKAVHQLRSVRNRLAGAEVLAQQKYANASTVLRRARDTERALIEAGASGRSNELRQAKVRRANAELTVSQFRAERNEAQRQTKAANRTLSLAKKGDWINAHASAGAKNPIRPKPRLRKISFNDTPLGPTPTGLRTGILKSRPQPQ